jgi:hypothetical protein
MKNIAQLLGITERAVQGIVADLSAAGYLAITKDGRGNLYEICADKVLDDPMAEDRSVGDLISFFLDKGSTNERHESQQIPTRSS